MVKNLGHREYASSDMIECGATWCPGCGDYGVLFAIQSALKNLEFPHKDVVISSGIGCSSNLPHFMNTYGFHGLHGRALPFATGVKLANPELTVITVGGDGDGMGLGMGHFVHTSRRNLNITYIMMNNLIYGLTTGQASPTSRYGMKTKTTPKGLIEDPVNPIAIALSTGATYVARGFSGWIEQLISLVQGAIAHDGFAFIDAISPCVTWNRSNTYTYFKKRIYNLDEGEHDSTDFSKAVTMSYEWNDRIPIGLFYKTKKPTYDILDVGTKYGPLKDRCEPLKNPKELLEEYW